jgi:DNA-binding FadR family transcriptional regulator
MSLSKSKKIVAYEKLKAKIINNTMKPGEIINETDLAAALNTSKTPVREANGGLYRKYSREGLFCDQNIDTGFKRTL